MGETEKAAQKRSNKKDADSDEDVDEKQAAPTEKKKKEKKEKMQEAQADEEELEDDREEDEKILPDLGAAAEKYKGRKKLPHVDLPMSEMRAQEKAVRAEAKQQGKKKKIVVEEEFVKPKLQVEDWD